jgi:hypothetical protein
MKNTSFNEAIQKGGKMWNWICRWFTRRYLPEDHETELADALFNWKYR